MKMKYNAMAWAKTGAVLAAVNLLALLLVSLVIGIILTALGMGVTTEGVLAVAAIFSVVGLIAVLIGIANWMIGGFAYSLIGPLIKFKPKVELAISFVAASLVTGLVFGSEITFATIVMGFISAYISITIGAFVVKVIKMKDSPIYGM